MTYGNDSTGKALAVLGGIATGAMLMYLFDPEEGPTRRQNLTDGANEALSKAGTSLGALGTAAAASLHGGAEATGSTMSSLAERARELAATIAERAQAAASGAADAAESGYGAARDTASSWANSAAASTRGAYEGAAGSTRRAYDRAAMSAEGLYGDARARAGYEEERSYTAPIVLGTGTAALIGAAAVYFLDKEKGADRRQQAVDLANRVVVSTRDLAHDLAEKVKGQTGGGRSTQMDYATSDDYMGTASPEVGRDDISSSPANSI